MPPITTYGTDPLSWRTRQGMVIPIKSLTDSHLANIIVMLALMNGSHLWDVPQWGALREEAMGRHMEYGVLPKE